MLSTPSPAQAPAEFAFLPVNATWAGVVVLCILGLFLAAWVIGFIVGLLDGEA